MEVKKQGKEVVCSGCGASGNKKSGGNNWKMCDKCSSTYCIGCYRKVKKSSSNCTAHVPWGKWLTASGGANMLFR